MSGRADRVALFDVDETLISIKSMFRFLAHHFASLGHPSSRYTEAAGLLTTRAAAGVPRAKTNRTYYEFFAGQPVELVARRGAAVTRLLADRGLSFSDAYAYADHASDLELLRAVAHPVVVGADPVLLAHAAELGWARLPGINQPVG